MSGDYERTRRLPAADEPTRTRRLDEPGTAHVPHSRPGSAPVSPAPRSPMSSGRASVPVPGTRPSAAAHAGHEEYDTLVEHQPRERAGWLGPGGAFEGSRRGMEISIAGGLFAFVGWGAWALDNSEGSLGNQIALFVLVLLVAVAVFLGLRLLGFFVYVRTFGKRRRGARLAHLATAVFLVMVGVGYLKQVSVVSDGVSWFQSLL